MNNNNTTNHLIQSLDYNRTIDNRHFALCESCFWSATIFKSGNKQEQIINACPVCFNDNSISLIPLAKDEAYELSVRSKGGLEKFSKLSKSSGY
jgi:hypothetical protein